MLQKLQKFISTNKISIYELIKRVSFANKDEKNRNDVNEIKVLCNLFATFLKMKVCKNFDSTEIAHLTSKLDIDQDGYINESDLTTCLGNLNHE